MLLPYQPDAAPQMGVQHLPPINILDGMLAMGIKHHQQSRLPDAERIYRAILAIDSRHAGTLYMLGTLAHQVGRLDVAVQLLSSAIGLEPGHADFHCRLGAVFQAQGKLDLAAASYRRSLDLDPGIAEAQMNLDDVRHFQQGPGDAAKGASRPGMQAGLVG
jgi:tetratricopeptide (TPR) repeat protein